MKSDKMGPSNEQKHGPLDFAGWAEVIGASSAEVEAAWKSLERRKLVAVRRGKATATPEAMLRADTDIERRLASYLCGYALTDNSYIVRKAGTPPAAPAILNTRITVEYIANYFRQGVRCHQNFWRRLLAKG